MVSEHIYLKEDWHIGSKHKNNICRVSERGMTLVVLRSPSDAASNLERLALASVAPDMYRALRTIYLTANRSKQDDWALSREINDICNELFLKLEERRSGQKK